MKRIVFVSAVLIFSIAAFSQDDDNKVEQYCRVIASGVAFSNKVAIDIDFGEARKLFSDKRLRDEETGKLKKFNTVIDALNYMGAQGWILVNAFPQTNSRGESYHYYFKKVFNKTEVIAD
jgi:hypothetical protein